MPTLAYKNQIIITFPCYYGLQENKLCYVRMAADTITCISYSKINDDKFK